MLMAVVACTVATPRTAELHRWWSGFGRVVPHEDFPEDCSLCHQPHGSVADNLLTANEPVLCLQCHEFHFHAGYRSADAAEVEVGGFERENPFGAQGFNMAYTTSCTQCHSAVHGSDLPTQTVTNSNGLVR